jgi:hypothetical protein
MYSQTGIDYCEFVMGYLAAAGSAGCVLAASV